MTSIVQPSVFPFVGPDMLNMPVEQIDGDLVELISACASSYTEGDDVDTVMRNPDRKWRVISGLQKAIRRGDKPNARRMAHAMLMSDEDYLWRRLLIIAFEDIGPGNLLALACTVACQGKKRWRHDIGAKQVLFWVVDMLCDSVKSRALIDFLSMANRETGLDTLAKQVPFMGVDELRSIVFDPVRTYPERMLAIWELGVSRFPNPRMPARIVPKPWLDDTLDSMPLANLVRYAMDGYGRRNREPLHLPLPFVLEAIAEHGCHEVDSVLPHSELICGVPSCAFDVHVSDGKRAVAYYSKASKYWKGIAEAYPEADIKKAVGMTIFYVDGAVLDRVLSYVLQGPFEQRIIHLKFETCGLPGHVGSSAIEATLGELDLLNYARKKVVEP